MESFEDLPCNGFDHFNGQSLVLVLHDQLVKTAAQWLEHETGMHPVYSRDRKLIKETDDPLGVSVLGICVSDHF